MIRKYLDYKRRKELDEQARDLWVDALRNANYKDLDNAKGIADAHEVVKAFYAAFYPNHTS